MGGSKRTLVRTLLFRGSSCRAMNVLFVVVVDVMGMVVEPVRDVAKSVMNVDVVPVVTGFESACAEEVVDVRDVSGSRAEGNIMFHRAGNDKFL